MQFERHLHLGEVTLPWAEKPQPVFVTIRCEARDKGDRLSFTGIVGPDSTGQCIGDSGQIDLSGHPFASYAEGWDAEAIASLTELWERWHMNDARPYCGHQEAEGWHKRPIDPTKPLNTYGLHFEGQRWPSWNMLGWVRREGEGLAGDHHPDGLLAHPCDTCGYKYGTAWLFEPIPDEVLSAIRSFPIGNKTLPTARQ